MVSKQDKQLRQQALLRAEKYKEEQAKKVTENNAAKFAQESSAAVSTSDDIKINPGTGRRLRPYGTPSISPNVRTGRSLDDNFSLVIEKKSLKKALASNKKEHHTQATLTQRDDPNLTRRVAINARRASIPTKSKAHNKVGAMPPEAAQQPFPHTSSVGGGVALPIVDNYGNTLSPIPSRTGAARQLEHNGSNKVPFFKSFTDLDSSFTFDSAAVQPSKKAFGSITTFKAPPVISSPLMEPIKQCSGSLATPGRSIFDVLHERATNQEVMKTNNDSEVAKKSFEGIAELVVSHLGSSDESTAVSESVDSASRPMVETDNAASSASSLPALALTQQDEVELEAKYLQQPMDEDLAIQLDRTETGVLLQCSAAVVYQSTPPLSSQQALTSTTRISRMKSALEPWHSERMFFADTDGYTRLVDSTQKLYDVKVMVDDDASDFDSIASPFKLDSLPALVYEDDVAELSDGRDESFEADRMFFADIDGYTRLVDLTQTLYDVAVTSDDDASDFDSIASPLKFSPLLYPIPEEMEIISCGESDEAIDIDDLFESFSVDCTYLQHDREATQGDTTPNAVLSFSEDENGIDPYLKFVSKQVTTISIKDNTLDGTTLDTVDIASRGIYTDIQYDPMVESEADETYECEDAQGLSSSLSTTSSGSLSDGHFRPQREFEQTFVDTGGLANIVTSYSSPSSSAPESLHADEQSDATLADSETDSNEVINDTTPSEPSKSAWVRELVRTMLGTESLFTFLEDLHAEDNGTTTKLAIVTTFVKLVSLEREKFGERPLSPSYTAGPVMASKIMPHTIFLGTTSLATFISHFAFGESDRTTVEELHRVFTMLSEEDLRLRTAATTGIMGALGRQSGRLSVL